MKKIIHKYFFIWDFDKEEKWLNKMIQRGFCLSSVEICRYEFEECNPGEYVIYMQRLENGINNPKSESYMELIEETGAEYIDTINRWVYFRMKTTDGDFELFSDNKSHIKYLNSIIHFIVLLAGINLIIGLANLILFFVLWNSANLFGLINILFTIFCAIGYHRLLKKRKKLETEGLIFE